MNEIIRFDNVDKIYKIYDTPKCRLKEALSITKKRYHKDFYAIKGMNLSINKGEIVGLLGKNGAGKSTLLKLITGVLTPSKGQVSVKGRISALIELGAGFNHEYTGMENIYLYGTLQGKSKEETKKNLDKILKFADIGDFINQPIKTYSSGMFARLAFSVAINVDPEILIVDEILAVGDLQFQLKCMKKMKEMMNGGTTIIFVSHDINSIRRFCTKAFWINKGELKLEGNTEAVCDAYADSLKEKQEKNVEKQEKVLHPNNDTIAEITKFSILDEFNNEISKMNHNEKITIEVNYNVYKEIEKPVLGIAINSVNNEYICGLNTLLDNVKIPWSLGKNTLSLEYGKGILVTGGQYYFDMALFEETATVPIEYISKIKEITVRSNYSGEGKLVIPHRWKG